MNEENKKEILNEYRSTVDVEGIVIGEIDFSLCPKESYLYNINLKEDIGICTVSVFGREGFYPHFHVKSKSTNFVSCPFIFEYYYFNHHGKEGKFTRNQLKFLDNWLREIDNNVSRVQLLTLSGDINKYEGDITSPVTRWQHIGYIWKFSNPEKLKNWRDPFVTAQPNYNHMSNIKG